MRERKKERRIYMPRTLNEEEKKRRGEEEEKKKKKKKKKTEGLSRQCK